MLSSMRCPYFLLYFIGNLLPPNDWGSRMRYKLISPILRSAGEGSLLPSRCHIFAPGKLSVGRNTYLGYNSYYGQGHIEIGDDVLIGPYVSVTASNHIRIDNNFRNASYAEEPVRIESGVWIGAHVCILAGVTIGEGSVIAAGSVVTKSVPPGSTYGGVPAHEINI